MDTPISILIVEDLVDDVVLLVDTLQSAGFDPAWKWARTETEFRATIGKHLDLIFFDFNFPEFAPQRAISLLKECNLDIPLIYVFDTDGGERVDNVLARGAANYVAKNQINRLGDIVRRVLPERGKRSGSADAAE